MRLKELTREIFKEKFPPRKVLFRVDAGRVEGLSFGHISRCLTLAQQLKQSANSEIVFLMRNYGEGVAHAKTYNYIVETLGTTLSKRAHDSLVMEHISRVKPDWLVVDLPDDDPNSYLNYARQNGVLTVCMDNTAKYSYLADVVVNNSILADRNAYETCLPTTRFLLGMEYFIMDDYHISKHGRLKKEPISVLMTFGGSDISGLTEKTVLSLAELSCEDVTFTVILGPGFARYDSVIEASNNMRKNINVIRYPKDMKQFFRTHDLTVCAGGFTLYELYKIGMPCIAIGSNNNESLVIKKFTEKGLILAGLSAWNKEEFLKKLKYAVSILREPSVAENKKSTWS